MFLVARRPVTSDVRLPKTKMLRNFDQPLINPTCDEVLEREPFMGFSHYLSCRVNVLFSVADEIIENLDAGFSDDYVDGDRVGRADMLMWLWMLGAYEVVRTMCQAKACFSDRALSELQDLKTSLSVVRMPAAKNGETRTRQAGHLKPKSNWLGCRKQRLACKRPRRTTGRFRSKLTCQVQ